MPTGKRLDAVTDAGSVAAADAGATYTAAEQALINEIKTDLNALVVLFNSLLAELRDAGWMDRS